MRKTTSLMLLVLALATAVVGQERMSMIPADKMTDAQKKAVADYKALRGAELTGPPWSVLLRVPDQIVPALQIRLHYLNKSVLTPKLTEFAILTAARKWTNNWEWNAHSSATAAGRIACRRTRRSCTNSVSSCRTTRASATPRTRRPSRNSASRASSS